MGGYSSCDYRLDQRVGVTPHRDATLTRQFTILSRWFGAHSFRVSVIKTARREVNYDMAIFDHRSFKLYFILSIRLRRYHGDRFNFDNGRSLCHSIELAIVDYRPRLPPSTGGALFRRLFFYDVADTPEPSLRSFRYTGTAAYVSAVRELTGPNHIPRILLRPRVAAAAAR